MDSQTMIMGLTKTNDKILIFLKNKKLLENENCDQKTSNLIFIRSKKPQC